MQHRWALYRRLQCVGGLLRVEEEPPGAPLRYAPPPRASFSEARFTLGVELSELRPPVKSAPCSSLNGKLTST